MVIGEWRWSEGEMWAGVGGETACVRWLGEGGVRESRGLEGEGKESMLRKMWKN